MAWSELLRDEERGVASVYLQMLHLLGYSQAEIARHGGISRTQVCLWAQGKRRLPEKYMPMIKRLIDLRLPESSVPQLTAFNGLSDQLIVYHERMVGKVQAYIDRGVVLRELWLAEHGKQG